MTIAVLWECTGMCDYILQYSTSHDTQSDLGEEMGNSCSSTDSRNLGSCCGSFWGSVPSWWSPAVSCELFFQGLLMWRNLISVKRRLEHHLYTVPCTPAVKGEISRQSGCRHLSPKEVLSEWIALVCQSINHAALPASVLKWVFP